MSTYYTNGRLLAKIAGKWHKLKAKQTANHITKSQFGHSADSPIRQSPCVNAKNEGRKKIQCKIAHAIPDSKDVANGFNLECTLPLSESKDHH